MSYTYTPSPARPGWIARALNWMDERAPLSWIVATVAAFTFAGPFGLIVLGFALFTGRFRGTFGGRSRREGIACCGPRLHFHASRPTGNRAFDAYKADTLSRLEREQEAFEAFLGRLREARDKAEFDQYMDERARAAAAGAETEPDTAPDPTPGAIKDETPRA